MVNKRFYIISAILTLFITITVIIGIHQKVWTDEGYSLLTTSHKLSEVPKISLQFELQPPIFFVLLKIWRFIFNSVIGLRLLTIIITCFSILYFEKLVRLFTDRNVLVFTALFALNPAIIWSALELRSYSLMLFMAILLIYYFYKVYLITDSSAFKSRLIYSFLSVIAIWVNYYLVLLLISNFIVLLFVSNRKNSARYLLDMMIPVFSTLLLLPFFGHQYHSYTRGIERITNIKGIVKFIYLRYEEYLINPKLFIIPVRYALRIIFLTILGLQIWRFWKKSILQKQEIKFLFAHLAVMTGILLIMVPFVNANLIKYRHTLFVFPLVLIAFFLFISNLKKAFSIMIFIAITIIYFINIGFSYYYSLYESGLVESAKYIEKYEQPEQDILCYRNELGLVFDYYYKGKNTTKAIPYKIEVDKPYNHTLWNLKSTQQVKNYFDSIPLTKNMWLLTDTYYTVIFGTYYNYDTLDIYINKNYKTDFDTIFLDGTRLRKISRLNQAPDLKIQSD